MIPQAGVPGMRGRRRVESTASRLLSVQVVEKPALRAIVD